MKQIPWSSLSARSCRNRRKGCNFAWEQCKLSDISEKSYEKNTYNKYSTVLTNSAEYGIVKQRDFFDKDIANSSNISGYYVVRKNYFVYNPRISNQAKFGPINRNKLDESGIMSPLYLVFTVHDIDESFLETLFQTTTWHRFMYQNGDTGARADRFAIKDSTFMSMPIKVPSLEEQHKLALAFQKLDQTITLHEEKKRQLERLKSALLKKMFADKSGYPVVRFKEFCDEWQGTKLRKISKIVRGASPRPISDPKWFDNDSNVGWLRISDVTSQDGRIHHLKQHISKQGQAKTRVISEPHLLLSIAATVGKPLINYVKIGVHDGFLIFIEPQFDLEFMFQWLEMFRPQWSKYGQPGSQINLNSDLVKNQIIYLPSREEQNQIGIFLNQIDSLINLHQQKINNINSVKKSLLQKMFI
ncbi:restriction endonuclease subunit S [Lactobacillus delbrueckii]|uniref:restriction endonuclease subunit S n=2 Tax=Lactobacillus delbrueckii TaxID=1584 RepID=UPI0035CFC704